MKNKTCYFCGKPASNKKHVPPKTLFPSIKYNDKYLNNNLITVPSCDEHNSGKSGDDEYFCNVMKTSLNSNKVPEITMIYPLQRSISYNKNICSELFKDEMPIIIWDGKIYHESISYNVDLLRFNNVLKHITMALYFYEYKCICPYEYFGSDFISVSNNLDTFTMNSLKYLEYKGENKEIFKYNVIEINDAHFFY